MRKKICLLLCILFLLSISTFVFAEDNSDLTISNTEAFLVFAENCRLDRYSQGLTVNLTADIDLSGTDFSGIPIFCGTFLGNGHSISGLSIAVSGSEQGLFRYLTETATVQDLHVSGTVAPTGSRNSAGGIAGRNSGIIKNCSFTGLVSGSSRIGGIAGTNTVTGIIEYCRSDGSIHGSHFAGGIAGENNGVLRNCENTADVNTTEQQNNIDISDITIGTITGTESASTVTDIGGIAGISGGTIRQCKNLGDVGYKHIGYNIGGITGTLSGYLTDCENGGVVSGRKDVGGIAGHIEPAITLRYETDTLQILQGQLTILSGLTDKAVLNAQDNAVTVRSLIAGLENHLNNAQAALDVFTVDPENPELKDADTYTAAAQSLTGSLRGFERTLRSLAQAVEDIGDDLYNDLTAITEQVAVIQDTLNQGEDALGGSVEDVSDADTEEDLSSKLSASVNNGAILGDINVGGIAGTVAIENDLDPEKDILVSGEISLNLSGQIRSVITKCSNTGHITAKKNHSGGIVGWQSLGLIKACANTGAVDGANYVGGIAGQSLGRIRDAAVKCVVSGDAYVGGIAGSGTTVTHCHSMATLSGSERIGALLGYAENTSAEEAQPILGNVYVPVPRDVGGIDGISYAGMAEPVALDAFLALVDLPEEMKTVTVTFLFEDGTSQLVTLTPGDNLDLSQIPLLPEKPGYSANWEGLDSLISEGLLHDTTVKAQYIRYDSTVASAEVDQDGKPILLAQGNFPPDFSVIAKQWDDSPALSDKEILLKTHLVSVSHKDAVTSMRYLIPYDTDPSHLQLYIHTSSGGWSPIAYTVHGSYAVFTPENEIDGIALTFQTPVKIPWGLIAIVITAIATISFSYLHKRKRKPSSAQKTPAS